MCVINQNKGSCKMRSVSCIAYRHTVKPTVAYLINNTACIIDTVVNKYLEMIDCLCGLSLSDTGKWCANLFFFFFFFFFFYAGLDHLNTLIDINRCVYHIIVRGWLKSSVPQIRWHGQIFKNEYHKGNGVGYRYRKW